MKKIIFLILIFLIPVLSVKALELTQYSASAILIEPTTNKIIYELNIHERRAPASMTKLMTLLLTMEALDEGRVHLNDAVTISKNASDMGGSQVFLEENSSIKLEELIKSVALASGNDAAVAIAEYIGGSLEEFINMMNEKVKELGLKNTNFVNVHGLDAENHYSSAYDMAMIAKELLKHPQILNYTSLYEDYLNKPDGTKFWLVNTNKLVRFYEGVDGLKTGYTKPAGYCLTSTAKKNNIRFITVVMGADTSEHRSADTTSLLNYAFNTYKLNTIIKKNKEVGTIEILKGQKNKTSLITLEDATDLLKQNEKKEYHYKIETNKVIAPVKKGDKVGKLTIIDNNNQVVKTISLTVAENIKKQNIISLYFTNLKQIITGNI